MELDKFKAMIAENAIKSSSEGSSGAINQILKILKIEMLLVGIFAVMAFLSFFMIQQQSYQYIMLFLCVMSTLLLGFLSFFYFKIKNQNKIDFSLKEVLENQIKSIRLFMKIYYVSTFYFLGLSLIFAILITGFIDNKFINIQYFWKQIALFSFIILITTLLTVKWWLAKFYKQPLEDLEKTLAELNEC